MIVVVAGHAVIHIIMPKKPYIDETIEIFVETVPGRMYWLRVQRAQRLCSGFVGVHAYMSASDL